MHFLDRTRVAAPTSLGLFDHKKHVWGGCCCGAGCTEGLCPEFSCRKAEVRAALARLQVGRCAYCEASLHSAGHIEHFRRKHGDHFPELTFDWSNLFLSCDGPNTCGHFKDRKNAPAYDPRQLVKPDEDDPDTFFFFHYHGDIRPRGATDPAAQRRATDTIHVFGLNHPSLMEQRRRAVHQYLRTQPFLSELEHWSAEERSLFVEEELRATEAIPFRTTVHHFLKQIL